MAHIENSSATPTDKALAWGVHLFTASGAIWGLMAIIAIFDANWSAAFMWMAIATIVDAFDGMLARRFRVKQLIPNFDGGLLDNMVDYFTYVLVPALLVYQAELVPPSLALVTLTIVSLSSGYQFSQGDAKTDDHFFTGFPSYWNVVVFYLFLLNFAPLVNFGVLLFCAILVFVPIRYVYPSRTVKFQRTTILLTLLWGIGVTVIMVQFPNAPAWLVRATFAYLAYYVGLSLYFTARARRRA